MDTAISLLILPVNLVGLALIALAVSFECLSLMAAGVTISLKILALVGNERRGLGRESRISGGG